MASQGLANAQRSEKAGNILEKALKDLATEQKKLATQGKQLEAADAAGLMNHLAQAAPQLLKNLQQAQLAADLTGVWCIYATNEQWVFKVEGVRGQMQRHGVPPRQGVTAAVALQANYAKVSFPNGDLWHVYRVDKDRMAVEAFKAGTPQVPLRDGFVLIRQ